MAFRARLTRFCGNSSCGSGFSPDRHPVGAEATPTRAFAFGTFLLLLAAGAADAQTPPAQNEIDSLISALGDSDCRFERNGKWYGAADAKAHLQRKYDWLHKRGLAATPELFIERAASRSSTSGRPYRVRCPGEADQASADWLQAQLRRLRAAAPGSAKLAPSPPAPAR